MNVLNKRIIVTGGKGFLGTHLINKPLSGVLIKLQLPISPNTI